jgi:cold-inducible RNA-binding protein
VVAFAFCVCPKTASSPVTNIFLGNLDFAVTEDQLKAVFAPYGTVASVKIVSDRDSGQPRGFAFIEMATPEQAADAIRSLDGSLLNERPLRVNEARPKSQVQNRKDTFRGRDHRKHNT